MSPSAVTPEAYEVVCPRCEVSFPPETRRCVHCGGPTMRPREAYARGDGSPAREQQHPFSLERPPPPGASSDEDAEEEPSGRGSGWISRAMGLVWIAALVAITAYRACTGQAPS